MQLKKLYCVLTYDDEQISLINSIVEKAGHESSYKMDHNIETFVKITES